MAITTPDTCNNNNVKTTFSIEDLTLTFRKCDLEDLLEIDKMAKCIDFNVGYHNRVLFYKCSPERATVITNGNQNIVGFIMNNGVLECQGFRYTHQIFLLPAYRKHNIMRKFVNFDRETRPSSLTVGFNGNCISIQKVFIDRPLIFHFKQIGYQGPIRPELIPDPLEHELRYDGSVQRLSESNLEQMLEYDRKLYRYFNSPLGRTEFIKEYTTCETFSICYVLLTRSGQCEGYGVLRKVEDGYYRISPAYADSQQAGFNLILALARFVPEHATCYIAFPATNRAALKFCNDLKLEFNYAEFRVYENQVPHLPIEKLFAEIEFWPI